MIKRVLISLCLAAMIFSGLPMQGFAAQTTPSQMSGNVPIMPLWTNTAVIAVSLNIDNNGRALMTGSVIGQPGTTRITVNAVLERINPNGTIDRIGSWNNLQTTSSIWTWERPHYVARGHNYRLTLTATVVRNGVSETVTASRITRAN
jgi:hypothetical protein